MKRALIVLVSVFASVGAVRASTPELPPTVIATAAWAPAKGAYGTVQKVRDARGIYLRIVDPEGAPLWRSPRLGQADHAFSIQGHAASVAVVDVTGDGVPDVVTSAFHGPDAAGLYVFQGAPETGFKLVRCEHPEEKLSRPFLVSDRPAPEGLDLACQADGSVKVLGRKFANDGGRPVTAYFVYRFRAGAYELASIEKP